MNLKEKTLAEINANSPEEQKDALIKFLDICDTTNQWDAFTVCHPKKTGPLSYQWDRIYTFRNKKLFEAIKTLIRFS